MLNRSGHRNRLLLRVLLGVALLVLLSGSGLALAASDLPEGTPSIFQRAGESLRLVLTRDPLQRGELHLLFAERQLALLEAGPAPEADVGYHAHLTAFRQLLPQAADRRRPDPAWEDRIQGLLVSHQVRLEEALKRAPDSSADPVRRAWVQSVVSQIDLLLFAADQRLPLIIDDALSGRMAEATQTAEQYEARMFGTQDPMNLLLNGRSEASSAAAWASVDKLKQQTKRHQDRLVAIYNQAPTEVLGPIERALKVCAVCGGN